MSVFKSVFSLSVALMSEQRGFKAATVPLPHPLIPLVDLSIPLVQPSALLVVLMSSLCTSGFPTIPVHKTAQLPVPLLCPSSSD